MALAGDAAREYLTLPGYRKHPAGVTLQAPPPRATRFVRDLLHATRDRLPQLGCFGLHEWAMVYRQPPGELRHGGTTPLRLSQGDIDAVVDTLPVRCTHYDAFRFFTAQARPRNALQPTRASQRDHEQPGCLHATMDLYKWAYKLAPATPSELVADCLELAADARELDMRASPYDLGSLGHRPVRIETAAGRAEYARAQAALAARAAPLRDRLVGLCDELLAMQPGAPEQPLEEHGA